MWLKPKKAAEYACISKGQIYQWMKNGLNYYKIGKNTLLSTDDIDFFIKSHSVNNEYNSTNNQYDSNQIAFNIISKLQCQEK